MGNIITDGIKGIFSSGVSTLIEKGGAVVDRFIQSPDEKAKVKEEMAKILTEQLRILEKGIGEEMNAKKEIMIAELQQGDLFTKRARPWVVYGGLIMIGVNHVVLPFIFAVLGIWFTLPENLKFTLPGEFWAAWGSVVSVWSLGRSLERRGASNKLIQTITGNKL